MISNERGGLVGCRKVFRLEKYWGVQVGRGDKVLGRFKVSRISE